MKRTLSVVLTLALAVPALPLTAATPGAQDDHGRWSRVLALRSGSPIVVTVSGAFPRAEQYFVSATDEVMTVLDIAHLSSSRDAARILLDVAKQYPEYLAGGSGEYRAGDFRLTGAALFYRGREVAAAADFVRVIPKDKVIEVIKPARNASAAAVAGAVGVGVAIDVLLLPYFFMECRGCGAGFVFTSIGLPVASGILTAFGGHRKAETIYRA